MFQHCQNTCWLSNIIFMFDRCLSCSAAETPDKYKCHSSDLKCTLTGSKILNGALATPTLMGLAQEYMYWNTPDSKVHGANMGPTWGRQDPGGPHVGHANLAILDITSLCWNQNKSFLSFYKYHSHKLCFTPSYVLFLLIPIQILN